jgi:D-glycero-alpha-D-manno-heptose-7-phosphate kinase
MKLVKTPLRISYVGGGTDYPSYYLNNEGCGVIAAAINQYVYIYSHKLSPIAKEQIRFTYRETESVNAIGELKHPVLREMLKLRNWPEKTNFGTFSDLPSGVGLGGSSSFAVGLAHLILNAESGEIDPHVLAELAVRVEREELKEPGGIQDHYVAAFGGLRKYEFKQSGVEVSPKLISQDAVSYLEERQMLIWLEETRDSETHAAVTESEIGKSNSYLKETIDLFQETSRIFSDDLTPVQTFDTIKEAVTLGWGYKKRFTSELSPIVQSVETVLSKFSDVGYKLCGAGGSGFLLILAEPDILAQIKSTLPGYSVLYPKISLLGSSVQSPVWE